MPISADDFKQWAQGDIIDPVVLVEASHSTGMVYTADRLYVTGNDESPANISYQVCLTSKISIQFGVGEISIGALRFFNDGSLDEWANFEWTNGQVEIYLGDRSWARADFKKMFSAKVSQVTNPYINQWQMIATADNDTAALPVTPVTGAGANLGITTGEINGTECIYVGTLSGAKYFTFGDKSFLNVPSLSARSGAQVYPIDWDDTIPNAFKLIGLDNPTSVTGYGESSTLTVKPFIEAVCALIGMAINQDSFDNFPDYLTQARFRESNTSFSDVITECLSGLGAFYRINSDGELEIHQLDPENVPAIAQLVPSDIKSLVQIGEEKRLKTIRYHYRIDHYGESTIKSTSVRSNTIPIGYEYIEEKEFNSIVKSSVLTAEIDRQLALRNVNRRTFKCILNRLAPHLSIGHTIAVQHESAGWRASINATIIGITHSLTNNLSELILWR